MVIVELSWEVDNEELRRMTEWCKSSCRGKYHYFPPNYNLSEYAKLWFNDEYDATVFNLVFMTNGKS